MTLIGLKGIVKSYGGRRILDELDLDVNPGARIGIVGPNGGGKSTLLRILSGLEEPDAGVVARRRDVTTAWLPQHVEGEERTPLEVVLEARPDLRELEQELLQVEERVGQLAHDLGKMERALARQEQLLERWTAAGGPGFEGRCRAHLVALGFDDADLALPTSALSGGQRKLVGLARCLAGDPSVLVLDEPETHLDAARRSLLEELVQEFDGAVVTVSHDRYLLDETVAVIAELERGRVRLWPGNYSAYVTQRELELVRQQQQWVTQRKEIARMEEAIRRFEHWAHIVVDERHAKAARSMQKRLDKLDKIDRPVLERRKIALRLHPHERGGQRIVELRSVSKAFDGGEPILDGVELTILRGERVGVVGPNGAGKTVLVKLLAQEHEPTAGERWAGPSIRVGYLPQSPEASFGGRAVIDVVRANHRCTEGEAVALLMKFLFDYEQVRRPTTTLSGGELTRLHLLLLMLGGANFLVLDEPTNHLDIDSVEMLEAALEEFDGTVIFTSHDRYFLDRIADRIVEVDGGVRDYEGGYSSWFEQRRAPAL